MAEIINRDDKNGLLTAKYRPAGEVGGYRLIVVYNGAPVRAYNVREGLGAFEDDISPYDWDVARSFAPVL